MIRATFRSEEREVILGIYIFSSFKMSNMHQKLYHIISFTELKRKYLLTLKFKEGSGTIPRNCAHYIDLRQEIDVIIIT